MGLCQDYAEMSKAYRPSHVDATYDWKYGVRSIQGGGRSSARETIGRVAAGAVAKKILKLKTGTYVTLETEVTNKGALALYGRLGFIKAKRLFRYYLNGVDAFRLKVLFPRPDPSIPMTLQKYEGECYAGHYPTEGPLSSLDGATSSHLYEAPN